MTIERARDISEDQTLQLLSQLSEMIPDGATQKDVLERVLWLIRELVRVDSAVVFELVDGQLLETVSRSAHHVSLRTMDGVLEPCLSKAWKTQSWQLFSDEEERLFPDEKSSLVVPLKNFGILYLGRRDSTRFTSSEVGHILSLCQQAYFALINARLLWEQESVRFRQMESKLDLVQGVLGQVSKTVEVITGLMEHTRPFEVLRAAGEALKQIADFRGWAIFVDRTPPFYLKGGSDESVLDDDVVQNLGQDFKQVEGTQLLNMHKSSYGLPSPLTKSVLLCPLVAENESIGTMMLFTERTFFTVQEQRMVSHFALAVGARFRILDLHDELKFSQTKLVQSSKMAAVGQLAAGVAHELNTPLSSITLGLQSALRIFERKPERARTRLETSLESCQHLQSIISKLLTYSHAKSYEDEEPDLNKVVETTLSLVQHQLGLQQITVETDLEENEAPLIKAKANELQQVLLNLVNNAKDAIVAADGDERKISIRTRAGGEFVALMVADTGIGMDAETVARVFEPFYTTKDIGSGTGLGLAIAKEIVESYGGDIEIRSSLGGGTRFLLRFVRA